MWTFLHCGNRQIRPMSCCSLSTDHSTSWKSFRQWLPRFWLRRQSCVLTTMMSMFAHAIFRPTEPTLEISSTRAPLLSQNRNWFSRSTRFSWLMLPCIVTTLIPFASKTCSSALSIGARMILTAEHVPA